jgi:ABC-type phosphate transport system substrate-binding protein
VEWSVIDSSIIARGDWDIRVFQRDAKSDTQHAMEKFMEGNGLAAPLVEYYVDRNGREVVLRASSFDSHEVSLGYTLFSHLGRLHSAPRVKVLTLNGVEANADSIMRGEYDAAVTYYAVIRSDEEHDSFANRMVRYATSIEGQEAIERAGHVRLR